MLSDQPPSISSGRLDKEIQLQGAARVEMFEFIAAELPQWRDHPERPACESETGLTEHLAAHLNSATHHSADWSHLQFCCETRDESHAGRRIDLTAKPKAAVIFIDGRRHNQFQSLFPIECKRLPTPRGADRDEREYVFTSSGTTGGIQRFKLGLHGGAHTFAAMIAYVQKETPAHWEQKVNGWISDLAQSSGPLWSPSDAIRPLSHDPAARVQTLQSRHQRTGGLDDIELRHLWIEMN